MCAKPVRADHSHVIIITMSQLSKTSLGGDMGLTLKTLTPARAFHGDMGQAGATHHPVWCLCSARGGGDLLFLGLAVCI